MAAGGLSPFLGRDVEVERVAALVRVSPVVTLTGPPGCGKTRLARAVATRMSSAFADGIAIVALAEVRDPEMLESALTAALGVREQPGRSLEAQLGDRSILIVLDNCEHLLAHIGPIVERLIAGHSTLTVLATSRSPLRVTGEVTLAVAPLPIDAAAALFASRSTANLERAEVIRICDLLGGLPLAIELAAALGSAEIEEHPVADLLTAGVDRLTVDGRRALAFLAAWPGGCAADAVAAFGIGSGVDELLDGSLAVADHRGPTTRYRLPEPVVEHASEALGGSDQAEAQEGLARWALDVGRQVARGLAGDDQPKWLGVVDAELSNLRVAFGLLVGRNPGDACGLALDLSSYWLLRGYLTEGVSWLERAQRIDGAVPAAVASRLGVLYQAQGRMVEAKASYETAVDAGREAGQPQVVAAGLGGLGQIALITGNVAGAADLLKEARELADESGAQETMLTATHALATLARVTGAYDEAMTLTEETIAFASKVGDRKALALALLQLGGLLQLQGAREEARRHLEEALAAAREIGFAAVIASAVGNLGSMAAEDGEFVRARELLAESLEVTRATGDVRITMISLFNLAETTVWAGDPEAARPLYGEAHAIARRLGDRRAIAFVLNALGDLWLAEGDADRAALLYHESGRTRRSIGDQRGLMLTVEAAAAVACARGDLEGAATLIWGVDAARAAVGAPREPSDANRVDEIVAKLGGEGPARQEALPFDALVTRALELLVDTPPDGPLPRAESAGPGLTIRTLGRFEVVVNGAPLSPSAWQSKKARDLLKHLIVHRGQPAPRDLLVDALWPETDSIDAARLSARLSVALSTLRSLIGAPAIVSDGRSVALDRSSVDIDIERFLAHASAGRLEEAAAAYGGEFLPDDVYSDWTAPLREEARLAYVGVSHALAEGAARAGDHRATVEHCMRILEADPYDDAGNRMLITALARDGRHGEARRAHERFVARMDELGLDAPDLGTVVGGP